MKPKKVFLAAAACALCAALCACSLKFWEKPEPYGTHQDTSGQQPPVYEDVTPSSAPSSGSEARVQHTLEGTVQAAGMSAVTIRQDSGADISFALDSAQTEEGALAEGARVRATYEGELDMGPIFQRSTRFGPKHHRRSGGRRHLQPVYSGRGRHGVRFRFFRHRLAHRQCAGRCNGRRAGDGVLHWHAGGR